MKTLLGFVAGASLGVAATLGFQRLGNPNPAGAEVQPGEPTTSTAGAAREARTVFERTLLQFQADKNLQTAQQGFLRSAELDPSYVPPRVNLAKLAESQDDWDGAIQWQQQVTQTAQPAVAAKAQEDLNRLRKLKLEWSTDSGKREIQFNRALSRSRVLIESNDFAGASEEAERAAQIQADRHEPYVMQAQIAARQGKAAQSKSFLLKAKERAPGRIASDIEETIRNIENDAKISELTAAGETALTKQDFVQASECFREAFKRSPTREDLGLRAAMADSLSKRLSGAETLLQGLVTSHDPQIRREATLLLAGVQDLKRVSQEIDKLGSASESGPKNKAGSASPAPAPIETAPRKKTPDAQAPSSPENRGYRVTTVAGGPGQWLAVVTQSAYGGAPDAVAGPGPWPADWIRDRVSEGYFITQVAGEDENWVVTASRGTQFSGQQFFGPGKFYEPEGDDQNLGSGQFSQRQIAGAMVNGYRITSVAGSGSSWVVVMSKDSGLGRQRFTYPTEFSAKKEDWIKQRWDEGYSITQLGGTLRGDGKNVVIVMSEGSGITEQTFEGPGSFPADWIEQKKKNGYAITSAAGLQDWLVVMSKGGWKGSQVYGKRAEFPSKTIESNR